MFTDANAAMEMLAAQMNSIVADAERED